MLMTSEDTFADQFVDQKISISDYSLSASVACGKFCCAMVSLSTSCSYLCSHLRSFTCPIIVCRVRLIYRKSFGISSNLDLLLVYLPLCKSMHSRFVYCISPQSQELKQLCMMHSK